MNKTIFSDDHKYMIEQLIIARQKSELDQTEVAKILGKTQSYVSKVESGQRRIDIAQLKQFAKIYNTDLNRFIKNEK